MADTDYELSHETMIEVLGRYYQRAPGVGHTNAVLHGAIPSGPATRPVVLTGTAQWAHHLSRNPHLGRDRVIPLASLHQWAAGHRQPLVVDNEAILHLAAEVGKLRQGSRNLIQDLRSKVSDLSQRTATAEHQLKDAKAKLAEMGKALAHAMSHWARWCPTDLLDGDEQVIPSWAGAVEHWRTKQEGKDMETEWTACLSALGYAHG